MIIYDKKQLAMLRANMRRPFGGVTTFIPSNFQADLIRRSLLANFNTKELGDQIWFDTGEPISNKNNNTWAPVLIKHIEDHWLFLTHHILHLSKACRFRAECDHYTADAIAGRTNVRGMVFRDEDGVALAPEDFVYNDLGETSEGKWMLPTRAR